MTTILWRIAIDVCTPNELEALTMHIINDHSERHIALALGISRSSVRDRIANATRKIAADPRTTQIKDAA